MASCICAVVAVLRLSNCKKVELKAAAKLRPCSSATTRGARSLGAAETSAKPRKKLPICVPRSASAGNKAVSTFLKLFYIAIHSLKVCIGSEFAICQERVKRSRYIGYTTPEASLISNAGDAALTGANLLEGWPHGAYNLRC